jgi:lipid-binding SYLF domain-containing protein
MKTYSTLEESMKTPTVRAVQTACFVILIMGLLAACSTAPNTPQAKTELRDTTASTLQQAEQNDPSLTDLIRNSAGYAIFPNVGKGAAGVGGAYGKGVVYQSGNAVGYCDMTQATIGPQLGGQAYVEILVFQTQEAMDNFKSGNFTFDAQATAVALRSGTAANAKFSNGVAVFSMDQAGLMYEASIGGQKFNYQQSQVAGTGS